MKNTFKTLLMATTVAATFGAGAAFAEGYSSTDKTPNSPNAAHSTMDNTQAATENVDSADIRDVQESLKDEGYDVVADGKMGNATRNAIRSFQAANNMPATGELDRQTLAALDVEVEADSSDTVTW